MDTKIFLSFKKFFNKRNFFIFYDELIKDEEPDEWYEHEKKLNADFNFKSEILLREKHKVLKYDNFSAFFFVVFDSNTYIIEIKKDFFFSDFFYFIYKFLYCVNVIRNDSFEDDGDDIIEFFKSLFFLNEIENEEFFSSNTLNRIIISWIEENFSSTYQDNSIFTNEEKDSLKIKAIGAFVPFFIESNVLSNLNRVPFVIDYFYNQKLKKLGNDIYSYNKIDTSYSKLNLYINIFDIFKIIELFEILDYVSENELESSNIKKNINISNFQENIIFLETKVFGDIFEKLNEIYYECVNNLQQQFLSILIDKVHYKKATKSKLEYITCFLRIHLKNIKKDKRESTSYHKDFVEDLKKLKRFTLRERLKYSDIYFERIEKELDLSKETLLRLRELFNADHLYHWYLESCSILDGYELSESERVFMIDLIKIIFEQYEIKDEVIDKKSIEKKFIFDKKYTFKVFEKNLSDELNRFEMKKKVEILNELIETIDFCEPTAKLLDLYENEMQKEHKIINNLKL